MVDEKLNNLIELRRDGNSTDHGAAQDATIRLLSARNKALLIENERLGAEIYRIKVERNSLIYLLQSAPHQLVTRINKWVGPGAIGRFFRKAARILTGRVAG